MPKPTIPGNAVPLATRTARSPGNPRLGRRSARDRHVAQEKRLVRRRKKAHGDGSQKLSGRKGEGHQVSGGDSRSPHAGA